MNSILDTQVGQIESQQSELQTDVARAVEFASDLTEVLSIFKYDLVDAEVVAVEKVIAEIRAGKVQLSVAELELLSKALTCAVDTQKTQVITEFLRQFYPRTAPAEQVLAQVNVWFSRQATLN